MFTNAVVYCISLFRLWSVYNRILQTFLTLALYQNRVCVAFWETLQVVHSHDYVSGTRRASCHLSPNNMNACRLSSKPDHFSRVFSNSWHNLFTLLLSLSCSFYSFNICPDLRHFLIIPILISASVNEWRDSSCRVWAFGLMWVLQRGSLGIVCTLTVHYCGYLTF